MRLSVVWRSASSAWCGLVHSPKRVVGPSDFCPIFSAGGMLDGIEGLRCLKRTHRANERAKRKAKESQHCKNHGFLKAWFHTDTMYVCYIQNVSQAPWTYLDLRGAEARVSHGFIASMLRLDLCGMPGAAHVPRGWQMATFLKPWYFCVFCRRDLFGG